MAVGRRSWNQSVAANVVVSVGAALAVNAVVFALGWNDSPQKVSPSFAPPGYVTGIVWLVLFGLMGAARALVLRVAPPQAGDRLALTIAGLIAFCAVYPFYTAGLQSDTIGLAGIVATALFGALVIALVRPVSRVAAGLILPLLAWLAFAGVLVVRTLQLNS